MTIYAKLLEARTELSFKKEYSKQLRYEILDGDTILEMVGDALAKRNILFIPSMIDAQMTWHETVKSNGDPALVQHALATLEMTFVDTESGDTFTARTHGSAQDYADKALGKAQTYAIKYFFTRMFLKGDGTNDEERTEVTTQKPAQPRQNTRSTSKPAPRSSKPRNGNGAQNADDGTFNASKWPSLRSRLIADGLADNDMHAYGRLLKVFEIAEDNETPWAVINNAGKTADEIVAMFRERIEAKAS